MTHKLVALVLAAAALLSVQADAAQPAGKARRIGILASEASAATVEGFEQALRALGYSDGKNVVLEWRSSDGEPERFPGLAHELVRLKADVIVADGYLAARAAKAATQTIPIVVATPVDPVGGALVASLAKPEGNVTGVATLAPDLARRQFALLKEVAPEAGRVAVLWDPEHLVNKVGAKETLRAATELGLEMESVPIRDRSQLEAALPGIVGKGVHALLVMSDRTTYAQQKRITEFAAANKLPAVYSNKLIVERGGLMSLWVTLPDAWKRLAVYVDKILKGARPGSLAVEQPTKFELVVNLKTAGQLGLTMPPAVIKRADKVIK